MNKKIQNFYLTEFFLFLIGFAVSIYLLWHHYSLINGAAGFGSFCSLNSSVDCDLVNTSKYSEIFKIPLAAFAVPFYAFAMMMSFFVIRNPFIAKETTRTLLPFSIVSVLFSIGTFITSVFILKTVCLMCSTLQAVNVISFFILIAIHRVVYPTEGLLASLQKWFTKKNGIYLGSVFVLFLMVHFISANWQEKIPFDESSFLGQFRIQPKQEVPIGESPYQGNPSAQVQIVEFADFQCPACGMAAKHMHRLLKLYGDRIQLTFKNFPLDPNCNPHITRQIHDHACEAAKASLCAKEQNKFEEMFEALFSNQKDINMEMIRKWAVDIGLEPKKFETCMSSEEVKLKILKDIDQAHALGLASTPTFFVNGRKVEGPINEDRLESILKELEK